MYLLKYAPTLDTLRIPSRKVGRFESDISVKKATVYLNIDKDVWIIEIFAKSYNMFIYVVNFEVQFALDLYNRYCIIIIFCLYRNLNDFLIQYTYI